MTREKIIKEHVRQEDLFKVLRLAFHKMVRREYRLIERLGLKRSVNASTLDNLALDMEYLHRNFRLVKK